MCTCADLDDGDFSRISDLPITFSGGSPIDYMSCFNVTINDDQYVEDDEDFTVSISSTGPVNNDTKEITITDNDCECAVMQLIHTWLMLMNAHIQHSNRC